MPLAKIHVVEGRYDETRIAKVSGAIRPDYPRSHFHRRAIERDAARTFEGRQHPRRRGGRRFAGRPDDHALRSSRREFLIWPGRGPARQRCSARTKIACRLIFRSCP
jgi:hypothetical protein